MNQILTRLKLIKNVSLDLRISKAKFIKSLKNNVDWEDINFYTHLLEPFSGGISKYKGIVGHKGFMLKQRSRLFDIGKNISVISGSYKAKGKSITIEMEINGFRGGMKLYYGLLGIFYAIYLANLLTTMVNGQLDKIGFTILITLLQMIFLFGVPYFIMQRSIRYTQQEIVRDLSLLSK